MVVQWGVDITEKVNDAFIKTSHLMATEEKIEK